MEVTVFCQDDRVCYFCHDDTASFIYCFAFLNLKFICLLKDGGKKVNSTVKIGFSCGKITGKTLLLSCLHGIVFVDFMVRNGAGINVLL